MNEQNQNESSEPAQVSEIESVLLAAPALDFSAIEVPRAEAMAESPAQAFGAAPVTLDGYHMVVAITEETINFQFELLWRRNVIKKNFVIEDEDSGSTLNATMGAPRVELLSQSEAPRAVLLVLELKSGEANLKTLRKGQIVETKFEVKDWKLAFRVNLDMRYLEQKHSGAVPEEVKRLLQFNSDQFRIRQLFMNFQSLNLASFDFDRCTDGEGKKLGVGATEPILRAIGLSYAKLRDEENPFILGYSIETKTNTSRPLAVFEPTTGTFSTFWEPRTGQPNAGLGCLNFLLMTRGEKLPDDPRAGLFRDNWMRKGAGGSAQEQVGTRDGRMVISAREFEQQYVEGLLLRGIRDAFQFESEMKFSWLDDLETLKANIKRNATSALFDDKIAGSFAKAFNSHSKTGLWSAMSYSHVKESDNAGGVEKGRSENRELKACVTRWAEGTSIQMDGAFLWWDSVNTRDIGMIFDDTFECWIGASVSFTIRISAATDGALHVNVSCGDIVSDKDWQGKAKYALEGKPIMEAFVARGESFTKYVMENLKKELVALLATLQMRVILPAGDVFFFKNISFDEDRNVLIDITYDTKS